MATPSQRDAYRRAREWIDHAIDLLKPGVSSDHIARSFPTADEIGFGGEMDAFGLDFCHGLGLELRERPLVSSGSDSLDDPIEAQGRHGVRRRNLLSGVRRLFGGAHRGGGHPDADGAEKVISLYPAQELPIANPYPPLIQASLLRVDVQPAVRSRNRRFFPELNLEHETQLIGIGRNQDMQSSNASRRTARRTVWTRTRPRPCRWQRTAQESPTR